jgi:hypothetical protein
LSYSISLPHLWIVKIVLLIVAVTRDHCSHLPWRGNPLSGVVGEQPPAVALFVSLGSLHWVPTFSGHSTVTRARPVLPRGGSSALGLPIHLITMFLKLYCSVRFIQPCPLSFLSLLVKYQAYTVDRRFSSPTPASQLLPFPGILHNTSAHLTPRSHLYLRWPKMAHFLYLLWVSTWTTPLACMLLKIPECERIRKNENTNSKLVGSGRE